MQTIYLIRHATPDWGRTDLVYHLPPGPPLTAEGRQEAVVLGQFLRQAGVIRLYCSPLVRCHHTAQIAGLTAGIPVEVAHSLTEVQPGETPDNIFNRVSYAVQHALQNSGREHPVGLITHGGPITVMLEKLGMDQDTLSKHRIYDHRNPLPPAAAWKASRASIDTSWLLEMAFIPALPETQPPSPPERSNVI